MTNKMQGYLPGKENGPIKFEPEVVNIRVPVGQNVFKIDLAIVNTEYDSNALIMSALVNGSTSNMISQISTLLSREMLSLAIASSLNNPVDTTAKMDKMHALLLKITSLSSSLTTAFMNMSQKINSLPLTSLRFLSNSKATQCVSSPSESLSFPCNAVNGERQSTKYEDIKVHQVNNLIMAPPITNGKEKLFDLVHEKVNGNVLISNDKASSGQLLRQGAPKQPQREEHTVGCPWCQQVFVEQKNLVEHLCLHNNERPFNYLHLPTENQTEA